MPMKTRLSIVTLFTLIISLGSCSHKNFSYQFVSRYISDSNWLYQLQFVPNKTLVLQSGKKNVDFVVNAGGHFIIRKREIDEFIFTPVTTGVLVKFQKDTAVVQFSEDPDGYLTFAKDKKEDLFYLVPDTIIDERFVIYYQNRLCVTSKKEPKIRLQVQGVEMSQVNKNRMIQKGIRAEKMINKKEEIPD